MEKVDFLLLTFFRLCSCLDVFTSRWWAWTLIKGLSPEEALQVRAKVASLEALKGQRADLGLQRAWEGNYLVSVRAGSCCVSKRRKHLIVFYCVCEPTSVDI